MKDADSIKERPILFSKPMVLALLDDTKTQTRRVVKPQPVGEMPTGWSFKDSGVSGWYAVNGSHRSECIGRCPYGKLGDRITVRETFFAYGRWVTQYSAMKGRDEWHFVDMTRECDRAYQYAANNPEVPLANGRGALPGWYRRPAIFMPRHVVRIVLEITGVQVERLNEISEADAVAEGIAKENVIVNTHCHGGNHTEVHADRYFYDDCADDGFEYAGDAYADLWEQINGSGSWALNPWVWCVLFKRVQS